MRREAATELLLHCIRLWAEDSTPAKLRGLSSQEWQATVRLALRHRVAPLLYPRLTSVRPPLGIPPSILADLRRLYVSTVRANVLVCQGLSRLLEALAANDVAAVLLKGAHLVPLVYGDLGLRRIGDVDVLIRAEDLDRAERALLGLGYLVPRPYRWQSEWYKRHHHSLPPYVHPTSHLTVDVHRSLAPERSAYDLDVEAVWGRTRPARIAGFGALVLSPEDLILHLGLHACSDLFRSGLRSLVDIAEAIRYHRQEIDWSRLRAIGSECRASVLGCWTLRLTRRLLGVDLPVEVLRSPEPSALEREFLEAAEAYLLGMPSSVSRAVAPGAFSEVGGSGRRRDGAGSSFPRFLAAPLDKLLTRCREYRALPPRERRLYLRYWLGRGCGLVLRQAKSLLHRALRTKEGELLSARGRVRHAMVEALRVHEAHRC